MKNKPLLDYNEEFEHQLMIDEEIEKVKAKNFINLMSEMFLKYEEVIEGTMIGN